MKTIVSIMDCCGQGDLVLFDEPRRGHSTWSRARRALSLSSATPVRLAPAWPLRPTMPS